MKSAFILSISFSVIIFIFSLIFKVAGKLRLTLPLIYFLAATISTFYTDWTTKNESKVLLGLYILISLVALSWMYSLIKKIKSKIDVKGSYIGVIISVSYSEFADEITDKKELTFEEIGIRTLGKDMMQNKVIFGKLGDKNAVKPEGYSKRLNDPSMKYSDPW